MRPRSVRLAVDPKRAFELLEDPRSLRALVTGARRIHRFGPRWPEPGTAVQHSVGLPPFVIRDATVVSECDPGRRLVLEARLRFLGTLKVQFEFAAEARGSTLTISEHPVAGIINLPGMRNLVEAATGLRNAQLGRRFARLVAKREELAASAAGNRPNTPSETRPHA
jgi:hypothetical protein